MHLISSDKDKTNKLPDATPPHGASIPIAIDVDEDDEPQVDLSFKTATPSTTHNISSKLAGLTPAITNDISKCLGLSISLSAGQDPFLSYPFSIHAFGNWPWTPNIVNGQLYIKSSDCLQDGFYISCNPCSLLQCHDSVNGIIECIQHGAPECMAWQWLSINQLHQQAEHLKHQLNMKKLQALNAGRILAT